MSYAEKPAQGRQIASVLGIGKKWGVSLPKMMKLKEFLGIRNIKKAQIYQFDAFPEALQTKIYKQIGLMAITLIATIVFVSSFGRANPGDILLIAGLGVGVIVVLAYITYTIFIMAATGEYDVYEGICTANDTAGEKVVKVINSFRKARTISFETDDGTAYKLYCKEPGRIARIGFPVTVYASKNTKPLRRNGEYVIYQYLAISAYPKREK